jgi:predicted transcriptional regulator
MAIQCPHQPVISALPPSPSQCVVELAPVSGLVRIGTVGDVGEDEFDGSGIPGFLHSGIPKLWDWGAKRHVDTTGGYLEADDAIPNTLRHLQRTRKRNPQRPATDAQTSIVKRKKWQAAADDSGRLYESGAGGRAVRR